MLNKVAPLWLLLNNTSRWLLSQLFRLQVSPSKLLWMLLILLQEEFSSKLILHLNKLVKPLSWILKWQSSLIRLTNLVRISPKIPKKNQSLITSVFSNKSNCHWLHQLNSQMIIKAWALRLPTNQNHNISIHSITPHRLKIGNLHLLHTRQWCQVAWGLCNWLIWVTMKTYNCQPHHRPVTQSCCCQKLNSWERMQERRVLSATNFHRHLIKLRARVSLRIWFSKLSLSRKKCLLFHKGSNCSMH